MNAKIMSEDEKIDKTLELLGGKASMKEEETVERSETHWSQASDKGLQRPVPKQFSEIDESASSQEAASFTMEAVGKVAFHDAVKGVDTDRGPVMDAVYNGAVTEGHRMADGQKTGHRTIDDQEE
jgi:hypothetical protein